MILPATYETVREAVERVFELFRPQVAGRKVFIKPNVLRATEPREAVTTHPAVLRAVVEKLEGLAPASIVVGDNPGLSGYGMNEECFRKTGLMEAAAGYYRNIGNDSRSLPFNPEFAPTASVSEALLDADLFISLPKFKTHGLTVVTGAIKNSFGILPGAQKARFHKAAGTPFRFHEMIVDVFGLRPPDLIIVDAVVGMEGNGPASPDLRQIGLILASDNGVAIDSVIATMMGIDPGRLRFLEKARERGLGEWDLSRIEVIGELKQLPDFKLPPLSGAANADNAELQALLTSRTLLRPRVDAASCTGCALCVQQCPVFALSIKGRVPEVDTSACIVCFCCQELCPEKAITLQ
jgi:uncharacterized protein (DUF362 family)/Pyruvate/2-oxoacid:ferredoxin oxidoreductase delta subunit